MGCDFSLTNSLEFSNVTHSEISSFSDINYMSDEKFFLNFDKVKALCQSKNFQKAQ